MNLSQAAKLFTSMLKPPAEKDGVRTHDYTVRGPGHDFIFKPIDNGKKGSMSGWGRGLMNGDYLLLPNNGGTTRYRIDEIEYYINPPDMWSAEVSFAPRCVEDSK